MLSNVLVVLLAAFAGTVVCTTSGTFVAEFDHFRPQNDRTVNFTYAANEQYYKPGGPFYVYITNMTDTSTQWIENGLMVDIAKNTSGALFTYDARYFGDNVHVDPTSLDNLQQLTAEQQLEDLASFVTHLGKHYQSQARTIVWGSGYGGTLATWARKKFPHLIAAAWSSSGILDVNIETFSPYDMLEYILSDHDDDNDDDSAGLCFSTVQTAFEQLNGLIASGKTDEIAKLLKLCNADNILPDAQQEIGWLFETLLRSIIDIVAYQHSLGLQSFCDAMDPDRDRSPLAVLGLWLQSRHDADDSLECLRLSYAEMVADRRREDRNNTMRMMAYQQCTQLALFAVIDETTWLPNRLNIDYHERMCQDVFGERYKFKALQRANDALKKTYGSLGQIVSHVLYTNGMLDPWISHGIMYSDGPQTLVLNIEDHARSADLDSIQRSDPIALQAVKRTIMQQLIEWSH